MKFGNQEISIGQQIFSMRSRFPAFKYKRIKQKSTWVGTLKPTQKSPEYKVKIIYRYPNAPKVWILAPFIKPNVPHRYKDKSLCLYYPSDQSWNRKKFIADTIMLWSAEWLVFYEIWCLTGMWYGAEAPHHKNKASN